jgi:anti-sigma B factor antagonist
MWTIRAGMAISSRRAGDVVVVGLEGEFDSDGLPALRAEFDALLGGGATRLCVNVNRLVFVTSTVLSFFVDAQRRLKARGGEIVFSAPSRFFGSTVRTLELHHIFEVFPDDEAALRHFGGGAAPA